MFEILHNITFVQLLEAETREWLNDKPDSTVNNYNTDHLAVTEVHTRKERKVMKLLFSSTNQSKNDKSSKRKQVPLQNEITPHFLPGVKYSKEKFIYFVSTPTK